MSLSETGSFNRLVKSELERYWDNLCDPQDTSTAAPTWKRILQRVEELGKQPDLKHNPEARAEYLVVKHLAQGGGTDILEVLGNELYQR